MIRRLLATCGFVAITAAPLQAQIPVLDIRVGAHAALPTGDFANAVDAGIGAYGRIGVPLGIVKLMGSATYTQFKAANPLVEDLNIWTVQAGPHFSLLPMIDLGIEGAYFSEVEEFGFAPNVSIGLLMLDITASYNTTFKDPRANWITLGVGLRF
jgi:hypothetical protein